MPSDPAVGRVKAPALGVGILVESDTQDVGEAAARKQRRRLHAVTIDALVEGAVFAVVTFLVGKAANEIVLALTLKAASHGAFVTVATIRVLGTAQRLVGTRRCVDLAQVFRAWVIIVAVGRRLATSVDIHVLAGAARAGAAVYGANAAVVAVE